MKFDNIVKQLKKDGYKVEPMQFSFQNCLGVAGTALVNLENGEVKETNAKYREVIQQITDGKSHIYNIEMEKGCRKSSLSEYLKYSS